MTWFHFALLGSVCLAGSRVTARGLLRTQGDPLLFTAIANAVAGLVLIPFAIRGWRLPLESAPWMFFALMVVFAFLSDWYSYRALVHLDVSIYQIIEQIRQVFIIVLGLLLFAEPATPGKIVGVFLVMVGVSIAVYDPSHSNHRHGIALAVWSTLFATVAVVCIKYAIADFSEAAMASLELLAIALLSFVIARGNVGRVAAELRRNRWGLIVAGALFGFAELFDFFALSSGEASRVVPVFQTSVVFSVLGGIAILGERHRLTQKLVGTAVVIAGVALLYAR